MDQIHNILNTWGDPRPGEPATNGPEEPPGNEIFFMNCYRK